MFGGSESEETVKVIKTAFDLVDDEEGRCSVMKGNREIQKNPEKGCLAVRQVHGCVSRCNARGRDVAEVIARNILLLSKVRVVTCAQLVYKVKRNNGFDPGFS